MVRTSTNNIVNYQALGEVCQSMLFLKAIAKAGLATLFPAPLAKLGWRFSSSKRRFALSRLVRKMATGITDYYDYVLIVLQ
jgi:ABC-type transport system involved in cytochrome c biogenesis ATPase subunit